MGFTVRKILRIFDLPILNNSITQILGRNSTTGDLEYIDRSEFKDGTVTEVTGIDGVTVLTGTTTPEIGLGNITPDSVASSGTVTGSNLSGTNTGDNSPNSNANGYADSKVQDSISDGTTDKAPSQNAVFDALTLKENLITYKQQELFDFNFNTNIVATSGFTNAAINGGALSLQSDSITPSSLRTTRGDDISECWVVRGNAGSPNGGYTVGVSGQNAFYVGHVLFMAIDVSKISDTNGRFGLVFNNAFSPLTSIAGNNAICVEIVGNQFTFKTSVSATGVSVAPSYTIPSTQWMYIMIEAESATTIRCKVRNGLNGTLVYNELITSAANIPLSSSTIWSQLRISLNAVATVASADNMFQYGKIATYAKKPNFLNYF